MWLTPPHHRRLGEDTVLALRLSVPVQWDGGVTTSLTAMWERAGPRGAPWGKEGRGQPGGACLSFPALHWHLPSPEGLRGMKM